ncbi:universal stress protein [Streptomyces sp. E11-3]|uniref:universal stress protein n=1 Tax=Streptomyces sp. E11-3 TaxID=3110112 RepID=UPI003980F2FA
MSEDMSSEVAEAMRGGTGRIVVGVDGSLAGMAALRTAVREARDGGRQVVAVQVWEPSLEEEFTLSNPERVWASYWEEQARGRLDRAIAAAFGTKSPSLAIERRVVRDRGWLLDRPGRALHAVADRPDDVLVIGAGRPRGRVRRYLERRASRPVLVVSAPTLARFPRGVLRRGETVPQVRAEI